MNKILDVTDRSIRRLQIAAVAGSALLSSVGFISFRSGNVPTALAAIALLAGVVGFVIAGSIRQRWEIPYRGHQIRFENSPLTGERLFLDGGMVSRGGVGMKMELRAPIRVGEGAGEEIMALVDAGIFTLRLRLYVEGAAVESAVAPAEPAAPVVAAPVATEERAARETASHSGVLGSMVMARRAIEFIGSVITIVTTASAALLWLLGR
jgi:hypothetical protein